MVPVEEALVDIEGVAEVGGAELAGRVAEPDVALAGLVLAKPDPPGDALGGGQGRRRQRLHDLVAVGSLGLEVGADPAVGALDAPVGVDQEEADAVVELALDGALLVGDQPSGAVGRRERVVGAGEDRLVQPQVAQVHRAVAARPRQRLRFGVLGAVKNDEQRNGDGDHDGHSGRSGDGEAAAAMVLGASPFASGDCSIASSSAAPKKTR